MRRPDRIDPATLSPVMLAALRSLRDGTRYYVTPATRRALTRRGLVVRVANGQPADWPVEGRHYLVLTDAGRAAIDAAETRAA